jgi:4-amino-4-deoxy-L-arabinose transferase-like glycosyltransferase
MRQRTLMLGQVVRAPYRRLLSAGHAGRDLFVAALLLFSLAAGTYHPHLFGRDEPREAEIARETLVDGHWITPHLCGLPFLEKPPLYYDLVAAAYKLTGSISPPVARSVSALFALAMLAAVFLFAYRWAGLRSAWFSSLILLAMPQFFRYSHTIVLDIAVGAFCTVALVAFAYWAVWTRRSRRHRLLYLFYCACAAAFLSKGLIGLFHIALIVGAFLLIRGRMALLKRLLSPLPLLVFVVPVAAWVYLYYREGGIGYLHEHFINNTVGRFLRIHFALPGVSFYHTDLGNRAPWYFYLSSLPRIAGVAVAILPLALWDEGKSIRMLRRSSSARCRRDADLRLWLILWALLPPLCLSFSSIKETSYILPSYAAIAVLAGTWVDRRLAQAGFDGGSGSFWLAAVFPVAAMTLFLPEMSMRSYLLLTHGPLVAAVAVLVFLFHKKRFDAGTFLLLAVALSAVIIYHSPSVLVRRDGCYLAVARQIWNQVGEAPLFLYKPNDPIRGSVPFSENRLTPEIGLPDQLRDVLSSKDRTFVLMKDTAYASASIASIIRGMNLHVTYFDDTAKPNRKLVLLDNGREQATGARS